MNPIEYHLAAMKKALPSFHYLPKRKAETFLLALRKECCKNRAGCA